MFHTIYFKMFNLQVLIIKYLYLQVEYGKNIKKIYKKL